MSKIDTLLKKATTFERLAIYSDRKTFLRALSQQSENYSAPGVIQQEIDAISSNLAHLDGGVPGTQQLQNQLADLAKQPNIDPSHAITLLQQTMDYVPGHHPALGQQISHVLNKLQGMQQSESSGQTTNMPVDHISSFTTIPRDVQNMLSKIVSVEGLGVPLSVDGRLGPKTREALNAFREKYNVPGNFSDQETFSVIKNTYNRDSQRYGK